MTCVSSAPINAIGPALHRDQTSKKEASWSRSNRCLTSVSFPEQRLLLARLYLRFDTRRTPRNLISAPEYTASRIAVILGLQHSARATLRQVWRSPTSNLRHRYAVSISGVGAGWTRRSRWKPHSMHTLACTVRAHIWNVSRVANRQHLPIANWYLGRSVSTVGYWAFFFAPLAKTYRQACCSRIPELAKRRIGWTVRSTPVKSKIRRLRQCGQLMRCHQSLASSR